MGNWSDGASRMFQEDPFVNKEGFVVRELGDPLQWLRGDILEAYQGGSLGMPEQPDSFFHMASPDCQ